MQENTRPMTDRMAEFFRANNHFLSEAPNDAKLPNKEPNTWRCEKHLYFTEDSPGYYALVFEVTDSGHRHYLVTSLTVQHWSPLDGLNDSELLTFGSESYMAEQLQDAVKERPIPAVAALNGADLIEFVANAMTRMVGPVEFAQSIARKTDQQVD